MVKVNLKPRTELDFIIHAHLPEWLLQVPFKGSKKHEEFLKENSNFYLDKEEKNINWSLTTNKFFQKKIETLQDNLKIDFHFPLKEESFPKIKEMFVLLMAGLDKHLQANRLRGTIDFEHQKTNITALRNIEKIFLFDKVHLRMDNFDSEKTKLITIMAVILSELENQITCKYPLSNFFSSDLQRIHKRLEPITEKNLPLLKSYQLNEEFKNEILETYKLTAEQQKLLLEYKEFLEKEQKLLINIMLKEKVNELLNHLLDKMQIVEMTWSATLATLAELESLLKLKEPLKIIIHDLEILRKKIKISFPQDIDQLENSLRNITLILNNPTFFQIMPSQSERIPLPTIVLFLNKIRIFGSQLAAHFANFQLKQIGLILDKNEDSVSFILFENNAKIKEALDKCTDRDKVTYRNMTSSAIMKKIQELLNLLQPTADQIKKSIQERKIFDFYYRNLPHNQAALFSRPALPSCVNDTLLQAAQNFLKTILLSALDKRLDLEEKAYRIAAFKKANSYSLNPVNFLKSMFTSTSNQIISPEEPEDDLFDALYFFDTFIKQQKELLHSLNKESTSLKDVEDILENGKLKEWFVAKKNKIINPILRDWIKNFAESSEYEKSREQLILAFNAPEQPRKFLSPSLS